MNFMAAVGPSFKGGFVDGAPVSNADIGKTIAHVLGLKFPFHRFAAWAGWWTKRCRAVHFLPWKTGLNAANPERKWACDHLGWSARGPDTLFRRRWLSRPYCWNGRAQGRQPLIHIGPHRGRFESRRQRSRGYTWPPYFPSEQNACLLCESGNMAVEIGLMLLTGAMAAVSVYVQSRCAKVLRQDHLRDSRYLIIASLMLLSRLPNLLYSKVRC